MQQVLIVKTEAEHRIDAALARVDELLAQANQVACKVSQQSNQLTKG